MADVEDLRLAAPASYVIGANFLASLLIVALLAIPVPQVLRVTGVTALTALILAMSIGLAVTQSGAVGAAPAGTRFLASAVTFWGVFTGGTFLISVLRGGPHPVEAVISGLLTGVLFAAFMYWTYRGPEQK